jgi:hypothetical protein
MRIGEGSWKLENGVPPSLAHQPVQGKPAALPGAATREAEAYPDGMSCDVGAELT